MSLIFLVLSDYSGSQTKLTKILLNGNNICMVNQQSLLRSNTLLIGISSFQGVKGHWPHSKGICVCDRDGGKADALSIQSNMRTVQRSEHLPGKPNAYPVM